MALVTMKRLFDHAMKEKYTVGAYNVFNLDTLVAVLQAAEKEDSPVIVQLSMGSRKYQPYFETFGSLCEAVCGGGSCARRPESRSLQDGGKRERGD